MKKFVNKKLEEFKEYIYGRKVAIIGLGVSNVPLLRFLYDLGAIITVFDNRTVDQMPEEILQILATCNIDKAFGLGNLNNLSGFDIIFRSPSCLPTTKELAAEEKRGAIITTEIEMFMKMFPGVVIGVTGSDGKTTTTSLVYEILKQKYNCYVGGNIGIPLFTKIEEMTPEDVAVLELSSFQLMGMGISPDIAIITNITPNHLNVHSSYDEYIDAKKNIFKHQNENSLLVLNYDNEVTRECGLEAKGRVEFFSRKNKLDNGYIVDDGIIKACEDKIRKHVLNTRAAMLKGDHNYENICAALLATKDLADMESAVEIVKNFSGVPHRLELVKRVNGVRWYNDSIGTSPARTIAGLNAFQEEIILIAGGYDKNLDYTPIGRPILNKTKAVILLGQTADKIKEAVENESKIRNKTVDMYKCEDLEQCVNLAKDLAKPGQIVLFSPASASFDMFKNFEERGEKFKELVNFL